MGKLRSVYETALPVITAGAMIVTSPLWVPLLALGFIRTVSHVPKEISTDIPDSINSPRKQVRFLEMQLREADLQISQEELTATIAYGRCPPYRGSRELSLLNQKQELLGKLVLLYQQTGRASALRQAQSKLKYLT